MVSKATLADLHQIGVLMEATFGLNPTAQTTFAKWIQEPQYNLTVFRKDGKIVGTSASFINAEPILSKYESFGSLAIDFLAGKKLGWLLTLAISPEYRRQNIGWNLAQDQKAWLQEQGCEALVGSSWVSGSEDNSSHMFLKAGFQKLGQSSEFLREQMRGTGAVCSACKKDGCECRSILFGLSL